jgi:hypothetical protein
MGQRLKAEAAYWERVSTASGMVLAAVGGCLRLPTWRRSCPRYRGAVDWRPRWTSMTARVEARAVYWRQSGPAPPERRADLRNGGSAPGPMEEWAWTHVDSACSINCVSTSGQASAARTSIATLVSSATRSPLSAIDALELTAPFRHAPHVDPSAIVLLPTPPLAEQS